MRRSLLFTVAALAWSGFAEAQTQPAQPAQDPTWKKDDPAKDADPPLLPAPSAATTTPVSTSGTDISTPDGPRTPLILGEDPATSARREAVIRGLEQRLQGAERRLREVEERTSIWRHLRFDGYVQPQLLVSSYNDAASPNVGPDGRLPDGITANDITAKPDGSTTNTTMFRLRRTRLRATFETSATRFLLQLDVLPAGGIGDGIGTIVRNAEATGIARWTPDVRTEVTAGLFMTPFRAELLESSKTRAFVERTWFSQNVFPTERDLGVHVKTLADKDRFVFDLAVINGQRLGEKHFVDTPDLNRAKDLVSYVTYDFGPLEVGANGYLGLGQVIDAQALRFKQYEKWGVNLQLHGHRHLVPGLGESHVRAELAFTRNMDTGVRYAFALPRIPARFEDDVTDVDGRAIYVRFEQDIRPWLSAGYRYDRYVPDTSIVNNGRDTHALVGVVNFSKNLRWMNEFSWAIDNVRPSGAPAPSKHVLTYSTVLQAGF